ncbi:hypothetical protein A9P82_08055 [Arachidicoccus ginsenosidimutans]|uniref:helix-turn-helix domain-containing protein n=1 Tax=Arachidicoccus sp. BS20 TaxID=1850526 RepID=UPI0007F0C84A|nr:helix-turn-helix domain-containing protein [Arachidicoccus sp. BS20]ANI89248.1 hypothetical protein A9P82_08055 [Arachidicoccus sp. BS20]
MSNKNQKPLSAITPIRRDQLVTLGDLVDFKAELLQDLKSIHKEQASSSSKQWLKSYEVRKLLGISPGTLQTLRDNRTLPFTRIGNVIFYNVEDIHSMMNKFKNTLIQNLKS